MPFRKRRKYGRRAFKPRFRRFFRRRSYRGRRFTRKTRRISHVRVRSQVSADRLYVKLKVSNETSMTGTNANNLVFAGNGAFDPFRTSGTQQPQGWDQYSTFYHNYMCFGSKITARLVNLSTTPCYVAITPNTTTSISDPSFYLNDVPYTHHTVLSGSTGSKTIGFLKNYQRTKKAFGISGTLDADIFGAAISADPSTQWYWLVRGFNLDETAMNLTLIISITYYIRFYNRAQLPSSFV